MTTPLWQARTDECAVRVDLCERPRRLVATVEIGDNERYSGWNRIGGSLRDEDLRWAARLFGATFARQLQTWQVIDVRHIPGEFSVGAGDDGA